MTRHALRAAAVLIAIAGVADPAFTRKALMRAPLTVVVLTDVPHPTQSESALWTTAQRVRAAAGIDEVHLRAHAFEWEAAACPRAGVCVVVSDGRAPRRMTDGAVVAGAVRVAAAPRHEVVIARVETSGPASLYANGRLQVTLAARSAPETSTLRVLDGGAIVGEATHQWPADKRGQAAASSVDVEWVPIDRGLRHLRVALASDHELSAARDIAVDVRDEPRPVLVYESAATWLGTFVRRAIEADPRTRVEGVTRLGPSTTVARGSGMRLTAESLARVGLVVIAAPDQLSQNDVDLLQRFVRDRGGSVILLPDRMLAGPVTTLVPRFTLEPATASPRPIGPLRASEVLTFEANTPGLTVLESLGDRPAIVSRAVGRGRVIVSGALDAWRSRDGEPSFAQFWSGLAIDALAAAGAPVEVQIDRPLLRPGQTSTVRVELRALDTPTELLVEARARCGSTDRPLRLWPEARRGSFAGTFEARESGVCTIAAEVSSAVEPATARVLISDDAQVAFVPGTELDGAVVAHGGVVVEAGEEHQLATRIRDGVPPVPGVRESRPMRSPWWIAIFASCLSVEWWLRRRSGRS
jgi:hypothetical protein